MTFPRMRMGGDKRRLVVLPALCAALFVAPLVTQFSARGEEAKVKPVAQARPIKSQKKQDTSNPEPAKKAVTKSDTETEDRSFYTQNEGLKTFLDTDLNSEACVDPAKAKTDYKAYVIVEGSLKEATELKAVCKDSLLIVASIPKGTAPSQIVLLKVSNNKMLSMSISPSGQSMSQGAQPAGPPVPSEGDFKDLIDASGQRNGNGSCAKDEGLKQFKGWLQAGNSAFEADVKALCDQNVVMQPKGLGNLIPATILLLDTSKGKLVTAPYHAPVALKEFEVPFFSPEFADVCKTGMADSCSQTLLCGLKVTMIPPEGIKGEVQVTSLHKDMVVVKFTAPIDYRAKMLTVTNQATHASIAVRQLPGPQPVAGQPNISFSTVDPETAKHNFGSRIAARYIVVDLQIKNPGTKTVQVRKSAVSFEADYISARHQSPRVPGWLFGGAVYNGEPSAYPSPYNPRNGSSAPPSRPEDAMTPKVFRFGLEHNYQLSPESLLSVLGTFDDITGLKHNFFDAVDLVVALAAGLDLNIIRGHSYSPLVNAVSGIVVPRSRGIFLNQESENKRRSQLFAQSFGDIVSVPPLSAVTTKVFLPRRVVDSQFPELVVVRQIRDVHMDLEVVSEVLPQAVAKGQATLGMTQDQVIQALGVPDSKKKDPNNPDFEIWTYSAPAPYEQVEFNKEGKVISTKERTLKDQLTAVVGKSNKNDILLRLQQVEPGFTPSWQPLVDGGVLWIRPHPLGQNLRFNKDGILTDIDYQSAESKLRKAKTRDEVSKVLQDSALTDTAKDALKEKADETKRQTSVTYSDVDIKGQTLTVEYDAKNNVKKISAAPEVED